MKVTFSDAQNSRLPAAIGACATEARFRQVLNEALERLMYEGHWHNTTVPIRFCAIDSCITMPPQVAVIEKVAICGFPATLRSPWHEYVEGGLGIRGANSGTQTGTTTGGCCGSGQGWCGGNEGLPRGYFPGFGDITATGSQKKLNLVCDLASDVGKEVLVLGYDWNQNWVRTNQGGSILDGEIITLAQGAGTTSTNTFSVMTDIQFNEERDGRVWAYEYNVDTAVKRMIGQYEYFETRPNYARYYFPGIGTGTTTDTTPCKQTLVNAMVKLNFWPVKSGTDYLCVPCLPALKEMMTAINDSENEPDGVKKKQLILAGIVSAKAVLNSQLQHFLGDGYVPSFNIVGSSPGYLDPVETLI